MSLPRTAVVTGVARTQGIGRAVVRTLLQKGYRVIGVDAAAEEAHTASDAAAPEASTSATTQQYRFIQADISDMQGVQRIKECVGQEFGTLNVLVHNAGIAQPYMSADNPVDAWHRYIAVNLTGAYLLSHALQPLLVPKASSIIHISSTRALQSEPNSEGYAASKAGLIGLTHAQAASMKHKTRVNVILPGWIDTWGDVEPITQEQHDWHYTGRAGVPSDIASLCAFLADEQQSGFITGQEFVVDGGVTKRMVYPE